jgi:two-component system nitrogen regulation response regulator GlnG
MPSVLLIDDEESLRYSFRYVFEDQRVSVLTAGTAAEGLETLSRNAPDVVVLDLHLPDRSGLQVLQEIRKTDPKTPVILITAHSTGESAIEAMKNGAFDYLLKPVELERLAQLLDRAFEASRLMRVPALLPSDQSPDRIVGSSPQIQELCKSIGRLAPQDVNVLIVGESGTGKELVARAIHQHSRRSGQVFLALNCAAIPDTLLESELFGHERGAFTGADRRRVGKFEQCDYGTLLLDEIGDLDLALQAKMLRVLQEQQFERIGGSTTVRTNVRVLAATNQNLEEQVAGGKFRKDLYYRLCDTVIRVPALRERLSDVPELAHYFLFRYNEEFQSDWRGLAPETLGLLQRYHWPGNVRELQSVVKGAMLNGSGPILLPDFLPPLLRRNPNESAPVAAAESPEVDIPIRSLFTDNQGTIYARALEALDRALLRETLARTRGNQTEASALLGISRNTLRQKMKSLGMSVDKVFTEEESEGE